MRISQKTEWALIAAVIAYMAFMSGFQPVRELLGSSVGKAVGLAAVVATWKYVSPIVAILLSIEFVRVAVLREHATTQSGASGATSSTTPPPPAGAKPAVPMTTPTPPSTGCPDGMTKDPTSGVCKKDEAPVIAGPSSTSSTALKQGFTGTIARGTEAAGGVQPDLKEKFAGQAFTPAPF